MSWQTWWMWPVTWTFPVCAWSNPGTCSARGLFSRDAGRDRDRGVDNSSRGETETKAFRARDREETEVYQLRSETEPRHYCASRRPRDRGLFSRDRGETETLKPETEAKTKRFSLEAEAFEISTEADRAEALLRLETASRPSHQDRGHTPGLTPSLSL